MWERGGGGGGGGSANVDRDFFKGLLRGSFGPIYADLVVFGLFQSNQKKKKLKYIQNVDKNTFF